MWWTVRGDNPRAGELEAGGSPGFDVQIIGDLQ